MAAQNPALSRPSAGALVLAAALPPLFLHARYSPGVTLDVGPASLSVELGDLAVLVVAVVAALAARRDATPLRGGAAVWLTGGVFLGLIFASSAYGPLVTDGYSRSAAFVSAAKFAEYAVLALAVPLLLRSRRDWGAFLVVLTGWALAASGWGLLQFLGLVNEFEGRRPGQRETSFLGVHDFAALSAATLAVALLALAFGCARTAATRRAAVAGGAAGVLGVVLSGAIATAAAIVAGAVALAALAAQRSALTARRAAALAAVVATVVAGTLAIRSADLVQLLRFVGIEKADEDTSGRVQTYAHRTVLAYIGVRIFLDHPVLGVGWQGSELDASYRPYLADARARYPSVSEESLPSPEHTWGVQNAFVQAGADMGVPGLLSLLALLGAGAATAAAAYRRGPPLALLPLFWLLVAAAELAALGLFAGSPTDALLWLALGLAVASRRAPE